MLRPDGTYRKRRRVNNAENQAHELTWTCYKRLELLSKDRSRQWFVEALFKSRATYGFRVWAYVIMPEHAHVLVLPNARQYDISDIQKAIKQSVARRAMRWLRKNSPEFLDRLWDAANEEYHFWQPGGGYDRNVIEMRTARAAAEYIHLNPVRRGLVQNTNEWRWSSAQWYAGSRDVPLTIDPGLEDW